ncbi:MAG: hypothetical protein AABZ22_03970, partial [Nitrospirota bacterium]
GADSFKAATLQGNADPLEFIADRLRHYGRTVHGLRDDVMEAVLKSAGNKTALQRRIIAAVTPLV